MYPKSFLKFAIVVLFLAVAAVLVSLSSLKVRSKLSVHINAYNSLATIKIGYHNDQAMACTPPSFIAHGGGIIRGLAYTNSLEALDSGYSIGVRHFEIDLEWSKDSQLVLIHDWKEILQSYYNQNRWLSADEFLEQPMIEGLTPLTLKQLCIWLHEHEDAIIITDIKSSNIHGLESIRSKCNLVLNQFWPQIYFFEEYGYAKKLGFSCIIFTLYQSNYPDWAIVEFCKTHPVLAVTMDLNRSTSALPKKLNKISVFAYAHTVNNLQAVQSLKLNGIDGFYTDALLTE